jgi:hypothetical protein
MSLFTATRRTEIRAIGAGTSLGDGLGSLLLQKLHLIVKLGSKLLVLIRKFPDSVLGDPVVPLLHRAVRDVLLDTLQRGSQGEERPDKE